MTLSWSGDRYTRTPAEEAYFRMLVGECPHPPQYRHEINAFKNVPFHAKRLDPSEWECAICGTIQVHAPEPSR